jgi:hypothetical protein
MMAVKIMLTISVMIIMLVFLALFRRVYAIHCLQAHNTGSDDTHMAVHNRSSNVWLLGELR